jgi:hypothetical protein
MTDETKIVINPMAYENVFLMNAAQELIPSVALEHGLDSAMMLAVLTYRYNFDGMLEELVALGNENYCNLNLKLTISICKVWDYRHALLIIQFLISKNYIKLLGDYKNDEFIMFLIK